MPELVKRFPSETPVLMYTQEEVATFLLGFLVLDQTTPQTVVNGVPNLNLTELVAPVGKGDGYLSTVNDILYYFAGGNRYKIVATIDNPVAATDRYASLWFLFGNVHD